MNKNELHRAKMRAGMYGLEANSGQRVGFIQKVGRGWQAIIFAAGNNSGYESGIWPSLKLAFADVRDRCFPCGETSVVCAIRWCSRRHRPPRSRHSHCSVHSYERTDGDPRAASISRPA